MSATAIAHPQVRLRNILNALAFTIPPNIVRVNPCFPIRERLKFQIRFESFALFNHTNFGNPVASLASPLLGQITSAFASRDIQFALKLHW